MITFFINLKLKYKIIISHIVVILSLVFFYNTFFEKSLTNIIEKNINDSTLNLLEISGNEMTTSLQSVENILNTFITNTQIHEMLSRDPDNYSLNRQLDDFIMLENFIDLNEKNEVIEHIQVNVNSDFIYSNNRVNIFSYDEKKLQSKIFENQVLHNNGEFLWSKYNINNSNNTLIIVGKTIRNKYNFDEYVALVLVYLNESYIQNILSKASYFKNHIYLLSDDNLILSQYTPQNADILDYYKVKSDNVSKDYIVTESSIPYKNYKIISALPKNIITNEINAYKSQLYGITMGILIISILFSLFISSIYTKRLSKLSKHLDTANFENFIPINVKYSNEISSLEQHFNKVFSQIKMLLSQQFALGQEVQSYKYDLLCAQINPHFLYNTLDFINLMAIKNNVPEISKVIHSLARFYKLSLNNGKSEITVADEIAHSNAYLEIQNYRFDMPITLNVMLNIKDYSRIIPNLIFQPIIENAILHGLRNTTNKNKIINLYSTTNNNKFTINIEDNGIGCDIERLEQLISNVSEYKTSCGIRNVNNRIQLKYGDIYGLSFSKSSLGGIKVSINIPQ